MQNLNNYLYLFYKLLKDMKKQTIKNKNGLDICIGKTYYYYNQGLGEIKPHYVKGFTNNVWAYSSDGMVKLDSLYQEISEVKEI